MSRYNDNSPVDWTCPIIDSVITSMEEAKNQAEYVSKHKQPKEDVHDEMILIIAELVDGINEIEKIRSANIELRDWGNEQHNRAEEVEEERDEIIRKNEWLIEEIEELKTTIEELEEKLTPTENPY